MKKSNKIVTLIILISLLPILILIGLLISNKSLPFGRILPLIIGLWYISISLVSTFIIHFNNIYMKKFKIASLGCKPFVILCKTVAKLVSKLWDKLCVFWIFGYFILFILLIVIFVYTSFIFLALGVLAILSVLCETMIYPVCFVLDNFAVKKIETVYSIVVLWTCISLFCLSFLSVYFYQNEEYEIRYHIESNERLNYDSATEYGNFGYINKNGNRIWAYPEKDGYTFIGWYTDSSLTNELSNKVIYGEHIYYIIEPYSYQSDLDLYPKYMKTS